MQKQIDGTKKRNLVEPLHNMNDKWQGQTNATPIGKSRPGMWSDPSVKEADSDASLAEA